MVVKNAGASRVIQPGEMLAGEKVSLRLLTLNDCGDAYVAWLADPEVNRYLETRWAVQDLAAIQRFVGSMVDDPANYLFAIVENESGRHIGNLKIGPRNFQHAHADLSYFIGDKKTWGKGYATEAIQLATRFGFERLGLRRLQAGIYEGNAASRRALEKAGYILEARFEKQLRGPEGWEDHLWFARRADQ